MGCIVLLIGGISGLISGLFVGWLASRFGYVHTWSGQAIAGAVGGAVFGSILGTISGDLNKAAATGGAGGGSKFFLALIAGAAAGALGGSQFRILEPLLFQLNIPSPF